MEKWLKRTVSLGVGIFLTGDPSPSVVPYYPQKTEVSGKEEQYFHRSYPEHVGVSSGRLLAMLKALERERRANIHNLMVIKDGLVICECSHPGYSSNVWHLAHSMTKTLTGMAVGLLVDDGLLNVDERLVDIFPDIHYNDPRFEKITVYHLLTMTSGVRFSEAGSVSETKWTEAFFESSVAFVPGTAFSYNSMNTYILARIIVERSGKTLTDFVRQRILDPLYISNFFWEVGPEGIEKGGWGVFMSIESWAKLGVMMLGGGVFEGKRILSEEWVRESTSMHMVTPNMVGPYNYGYQLWVSRKTDNFLFNGMLGQNVWVCPTNNIVVVINSGNNELFQKSPALEVIEKYLAYDLSGDLHDSCFSGDLVELRRAEDHFFERRHWVRPYEPRRGLSYTLGLRQRTPYPEEWDAIIGRYRFRKNNAGILPLFIRGMQNNFRCGVSEIEFERAEDSIYFIFTEGGETYRLEVGFYDFKTTVLNYRGERYIVKVIGEAMEDEDRNMLFKLEILLPEMPNTGMLKFSIEDNGSLLLRMSEMPNHKVADVFIEALTEDKSPLTFALKLFEGRLGKNFIQRKLEESFTPSLIGARVGAENYNAIMDAEREKLRENERNVRFINAVVKKFFHDADAGDEEELISQSGGWREFIGDVVGRIRAKFPGRKKEKPAPSDRGDALIEEVPMTDEFLGLPE